MLRVDYIKIENFKIFDELIIKLEHPTLIIGPNNSGKTSIIQAFVLWNLAVRLWQERKVKNNKKSLERGIGLNRLEITQIPTKTINFLFTHTRTQHSKNQKIRISISVGLFFENKIKECEIHFYHYNPDLIYCIPSDETLKNTELLKYAASIEVNLLYPMSGIETSENLLQLGAIKKFIGRGQTASVLRNICWYLYENSKEKWERLKKLMKKLFDIELGIPQFVESDGTIQLNYSYKEKTAESKRNISHVLDIMQAGRGQNQVLLLLAYILNYENSILLIDEPDAHLEMLRRAQIFDVLKNISQEQNCQLIVVTHSESLLNEEAKVVFLIDGKNVDVENKNDYRFIKDSLLNYGIEHYYKARIFKRILYLEGSTDKDMLAVFAKKLNHPVLNILEDRIFVYYTQNIVNESTLENEIERKSGYFRSAKSHFQAIQKCVSEIRGIGIFDNDNKNRKSEITENFATLYWKNYELENYFIFPETIIRFAKKYYKNLEKYVMMPNRKIENLEKCIEANFLLPIFESEKEISEWKNLGQSLKRKYFMKMSSDKKASELLENTLKKFAESEGESILLNKGKYYLLIDFLSLDEIDEEIIEKLNKMNEYLSV